MAWRIGLVAGCWILALATLQAGDGPDPRALVRQLGSDKFALREAASKTLEKMGAPAQPHLLEASRKGDFETRRRADLIYRKIQDRLFAAELLKPRSVRWQFANQPLREVLQSINAASGLSLGCNPAHDRELITVDTGSVPLWQALDLFYRKTGWVEDRHFPVVRVRPDDGGKRLPSPSGPYLAFDALRIRQGKLFDPMDFQGPFRFRAIPADLWPGAMDDPFRKDLLFFLEVRIDPKVPVWGLDSLAVHSLLDGKGQPNKVPPLMTMLAQDPLPEARSGDPDFPSSRCFVIPIRTVPGGVLSWSEFKGTLAAHVQVKVPFVEVADLTKSVGQLATGPNHFSLKVLSARLRDDGDLRVHLSVDNLQAFKEVGVQPQVVRVRPGFVAMRGPADIAGDHTEILDAKGRPLTRRSLASKPLMNNSDGVELILTFEGPFDSLAGLRLVVAVPRSVPVEVPFTLKNKAGPG